MMPYQEVAFTIDNTISYERSKAAVIRAVNKGVRVIWGISGFWKQTMTAANWPILRQAILDAAAWAQANGVYEFQIGNEMEFFNDDIQSNYFVSDFFQISGRKT